MKTVSHRSKKLNEPPTQQEIFKEVLLAERMIPDKNLDLHKGMQSARVTIWVSMKTIFNLI